MSPAPSVMAPSPPRQPAKAAYPKKRVNVACEVCRSRKTRCDAQRPVCTFCKTQTAKCVYRRDEDASPTKDLTTVPVIDENDILSRLSRIEEILRTDAAQRNLHIESIYSNLDVLRQFATQMQPQPQRQLRPQPQPQPQPLIKQALSPLDLSLAALSTCTSPATAPLSPVPPPPLPRRAYPSGATCHSLGFQLSGLSHIPGFPTPHELLPMTSEPREQEHGLHLLVTSGQRMLETASVAPQDVLRGLVLDEPTVRQSVDAFVAQVLPWYPIVGVDEVHAIVSRSVAVMQQAENAGVQSQLPPRDMLDASFTLFVLALGQTMFHAYDMRDSPQDAADCRYFEAAVHLLTVRRHSPTELRKAHCHILMCKYLLFYMRPLAAFDEIHTASRIVVLLLYLPSVDSQNPHHQQQLIRAFWTCYLIEHDLQRYASWSAQVLQDISETNGPALPFGDIDENSMMMWFSAEIVMQRIFWRPRNGIALAHMYAVYEPLVAAEVSSQLAEWQHALPAELAFSVPDMTAARPLAPDQKPVPVDEPALLLRAQYYAFQATLYWPSVVRLLTPDDGGLCGPATTEARWALRFAVLHVHALRPLMGRRSVTLMANIASLCCTTMFLLCCLGSERLGDVVPEDAAQAVSLSWQMLKQWQANETILARLRKIGALMEAKGIHI